MRFTPLGGDTPPWALSFVPFLSFCVIPRYLANGSLSDCRSTPFTFFATTSDMFVFFSWTVMYSLCCRLWME